jgi:hypothetical protein
MFIWTFGDVIGVAFLALCLLVFAACAVQWAFQAAARRIRNTFRNLWKRRG